MLCKSFDFFIAWAKILRRKTTSKTMTCGNFSHHISRTFLNHSSYGFKLNDLHVYYGMILSPSNRGQMSLNIHTKKNELNKKCSFFFFFFLLISSSNTHTWKCISLKKKTLIKKSSEKGVQFRILNCTVVQYNKILIDLIFG